MFRIPQIGIIYGSRSCEHEVSVISALQLYRHVDRRKYDVLLIYISQQGEWFVGEPLANINTYRPAFKPDTRGLTRVVPDLTARSGALLAFKHNGLYRGDRVEIVARLDCAIPVMHGLHGEDGTLQGVLEMMDIPYTSTGVAGSSVGMDKILMKKIFKGFGFPVLPGCAVTRGAWRARPEEIMDDIEKELPYP
ncbi:MAG: D-alanine--D-alanine ligase, partial [Christensenellales bacterium]